MCMYIKCICVKDAMCVISVLRGTRAFNVYAWMHIGPSMQKKIIKMKREHFKIMKQVPVLRGLGEDQPEENE